MFRAIGTIMILWYLSALFSQSFAAFDRALTATFGAVESAAIVSQQGLQTGESLSIIPRAEFSK